MNSHLSCEQILLLQAEFDGELDVTQSMEMTSHRQSCVHCREAWQMLQDTHQSMHASASYHVASNALRSRIDERLSVAGLQYDEQPVRPKARRGSIMTWLWTATGFGLGTAVAVMSTLFFLQPAPSADSDMADLVVASHLRSMQADHLLDIASNDQHNVKPWFDGKIDFAPPVKNLTDKGYPLAGGRLDYLQDREVAALVYKAGSHLINMLVWPSSATDGQDRQFLAKDGYELVHWRDQDLTIWVVSDLDKASLQKFISLWQSHD